MEVFINVSDDRFSINGIQYFKNFTPIVSGNYIRVVNTYDSKIEIMPPTLFSDIEIDSVTYGTVALTQSALLPVLFTRESLGGLAGGTAVWGTITGDIQNQTDLIALFETNGDIENFYPDVASMLTDQGSQTIDNTQYVHDASADPNVTIGPAWYTYLGTTGSSLVDYTLKGSFTFKPFDKFIWNETEQCYIVKQGTNANITLLETGDLVYEKDVDHNGLTLTIRGWVYDGGDTSLRASYTKTKNYA